MTVIHRATPFDTAEIAQLRDAINDEDRAFQQLKREHNIREHERCDRYNELLAARRPMYPTQEHLDAIDQVATFVHHDMSYGDVHGHPRPEDQEAGRALPTSVKYSSTAQRINVYAGAPYRARTTSRVWEFTVDEIEALRQHIRANKLRIVLEWTHEDGIAFVVDDARV